MLNKNRMRIILICSLIAILLFLYYRQSNYLVYYAKIANSNSEVKIVDLGSDEGFAVSDLDIGSIGVYRKSNMQVELATLKEYELNFILENGRTRKLFLSSFENIPDYSKDSINDSEVINGVFSKNNKYYIIEDSRVFIRFKAEFYDSLFELIENFTQP